MKNRFKVLFLAVVVGFCAGSVEIQAALAVKQAVIAKGATKQQYFWAAAGTVLTAVLPVVISKLANNFKWLTWYNGKPDASDFYRKHFNDALRSYGVKNPELVPLKNDSSMKDLGIAGDFFVCINEDKLYKKSNADRIHTCYHEAAHYVFGHSRKGDLLDMYPLAVGILGWMLRKSPLLNNSLKKKMPLASAVVIGLGAVDFLRRRYYTPWLKCPIEKEADAMAIKHLIKAGRCDVVNDLWHEYKNNAVHWRLALSQGRDVACAQKHAPETQERFNRWDALYREVDEKMKREAAAPGAAGSR